MLERPTPDTDRVSTRLYWLREITLVLTAVAVFIGAAKLGQDLLFAGTHYWLLAVLPATIGMVHFFVVTWPRYDMRRADVRARLNARMPAKRQPLPHLDTASVGQPNLDRFRPSLGYTLWGAVVLAIVFAIPAVIASRTPDDKRFADHGFPLITETSEAAPTAGAGATTEAAAKSKGSYAGGLTAVLFAAVGAYVSVTWRMIGRIHLNALTPRFLMASGLRTAAALMIAFVAGHAGIFGAIDDAVRFVAYFFVGLFTNMAMIALDRRARAMFGVEEGCRELPLCLVEGLSEYNIDHLHELGIWSVQHLATYEPTELSLRTLLPLNRILDWVDQAILISYFHEKIDRSREVAIRGAIDFMVLYLWAERAAAEVDDNAQPEGDAPRVSSAEPSSRKSHLTTSAAASATMAVLAQKLGMEGSALWLLGSSLAYDAQVSRIYQLWQRTDGTREATGESASDEGDIQPPIYGD
jgi:hypothetical protein